MGSSSKIAASGLRVLEVLKVLVQKPLTVAELLKIAEEVDDDIFRKEVVSKYINTLKALGFEIEKINDKYHLKNGLHSVNFNLKDLSILLFIEKYASKLKHESMKTNLLSAVAKIEKGFSAETKNFVQENKVQIYKSEKEIILKDEAAQHYERYCRENLKLEITYKTDKNAEGVKYKVAPINLVYKKGTAVFIGYDYAQSEYKEFFIQNIAEVKQLPQISVTSTISAVSFKLTGRLMNAYQLRESEQILERGEDYIIVSNKTEDRDFLLRRLLRYHNECRILYPSAIKDKMIALIEEMEQIYA